MSIVRYQVDKSNSIVMGVCSGFARMTDTDPLWWRLGAVVGAFLSLGTAVVIYLLIGVLAQPRSA